MIQAYFDGRGKTGENSKWSFIIINGYEKIKVVETLGHCSNQVAKYFSLIKLLKFLRKEKIRNVEICTDSNTIIKQILGEMKCNVDSLKPLCRKAICYFEESGCKLKLIKSRDNISKKLI